MLETAHKLIGNAWGDEGTTRGQRAWIADPPSSAAERGGDVACLAARR